MKENKNRSYEESGKSLYRRMLAISLVLALMLAAIPVASAFAKDDTPNNLEAEWGNKLRQLAVEVSIFNNFQTKPGQFGNNANQGQHLDKLRATLAAAQALVVNQGGFDANGQMTNQNRGRQAVQQLGNYLSLIRGLREKIADGSNNNNNTNVAVSSGNSQNNGQTAIQNNNNQNNQSNNQNSVRNNNSNSSSFTGDQLQSLRAARAFFNNFQTQPGRFRNASDREQMQRYLDLYASALRAAETIVVNGGLTTTTTDGQQVQGTGNQSAEKLLSMYLHMLRGLRERLTGAGK
jgi:hypothetical protein